MANSITLVGTPISTAVATDPDLCRVSGYLINAHGQALAGIAFTLRYCYQPLGIGTDTVVLQERLTIKADKDGYVEFDLLRGSKLTVEMPNLLTALEVKELTVPDASSVGLIGFLFPYVVSVDWEDTGPLSIAVAEGITVYVEATLSNGEVVRLASSGPTIVSSDSGILALKEGPAYIGVSAGVATLTVTAVDVTALDLNQSTEDENLVFFDAPAITLPPSPLTVTVT